MDKKLRLKRFQAIQQAPNAIIPIELDKIDDQLETLKLNDEQIASSITILDKNITEVSKDLEDKISKVKTIKGEDGKTPTKEDITNLIKPLIPKPIKGDDGKTPIKGKDYFDGKDGYTPIKGKDYFDGVNGLNAVVDYNKVVNEVTELVNFETDSPEEIRNKLELLKDDERLDKSAIKGIKELEDKIKKKTDLIPALL